MRCYTMGDRRRAFTLHTFCRKAQGTINPRLIISLTERELTAYASQVKHTAACPPSLHSIGNHLLKAIRHTSITTEINNTHPV